MVCLQGIHMANDRFIMDHFLVHKVDVHTFRLVKAGKGNIKGSPQANRGEFNYPKKTTQTCYSKLLTAYVPEESQPAWTELDLESVAFRIANPNFKYSANTTANALQNQWYKQYVQEIANMKPVAWKSLGPRHQWVSVDNGTLAKGNLFNSNSSMANENKAKSKITNMKPVAQQSTGRRDPWGPQSLDNGTLAKGNLFNSNSSMANENKAKSSFLASRRTST